jgi:H+-transporting ATPase
MNKSTALPKNLESQEYERMTADDVLTRLATDLSAGLKKTEVEHRRQRFGANEVPEKKAHPLRSFLKKFWGLTAWMLELIIVLSWILHKNADAYIVGGLLIMNSIINFLEEQKASGAVEELKSKLQIQARTLRDGVWALVPARELIGSGRYLESPARRFYPRGHENPKRRARRGRIRFDGRISDPG